MSTTPKIAFHPLRARLPRVCVALTGTTAAEMLERADAALSDSSLVEFRLDYLPEPRAAVDDVARWLADHAAATAIVTCRRKPNGGSFAGSVAQELEVLRAAAAAGAHMVDVEIETAEQAEPQQLAGLREAGTALIVSFHDFSATPDLQAVYSRMQRFAPDVYKVVATATSLADNLQMMQFVERSAESASIVGLCMGEAGIPSRVLSLRTGSAFTFAAAGAGTETAPGQVAGRTLLETYHVEQVDRATKVYGVAGNPVRSSLSPSMLNTAFRKEAVNAVYLPLQTATAEDLFHMARELPLSGFSVTMPLKLEVLPFLERVDALSAKIGAVNTVRRAGDGKFYGFNTDVAGIVTPLERRLSLRGSSVLVLGAGGAARAAVFGLADKGAKVSLLNRSPETAAKLSRESGAKVVRPEAAAETAYDVIVNATPAGMAGNAMQQLLAPEQMQAKIFFDLVYNPMETAALRVARERGLEAISGVEMFVQQGARQFEIWTGKPAPEDEMRRVVLHALGAAANYDSTPQPALSAEAPVSEDALSAENKAGSSPGKKAAK